MKRSNGTPRNGSLDEATREHDALMEKLSRAHLAVVRGDEPGTVMLAALLDGEVVYAGEPMPLTDPGDYISMRSVPASMVFRTESH